MARFPASPRPPRVDHGPVDDREVHQAGRPRFQPRMMACPPATRLIVATSVIGVPRYEVTATTVAPRDAAFLTGAIRTRRCPCAR